MFTSDDICCICLNNFHLILEKTYKCNTCCNIFHNSCIGKHLFTSDNCPLCRSNLITNTVNTEIIFNRDPRLNGVKFIKTCDSGNILIKNGDNIYMVSEKNFYNYWNKWIPSTITSARPIIKFKRTVKRTDTAN